MPFFSKMALGLRYLKRWGRPACSRNFSPDELAAIIKEAGFIVEESKLVEKDTKAVCLRGKKAR
jgi:hypothetical protein